MYIEKKSLTPDEVTRFSLTTTILLTAAFIFLFFAYWNVQVLKNFYYKSQAHRNIYRDIELKAPRGLIVDRHGTVIAENKINFSLFIVREHAKDLDESIKFATTLGIGTDKEIRKRINKYKGYPKSFRIPLSKNLERKKVIVVESRSDRFPEFFIGIEPARSYPHKAFASHLLGYMSEITDRELKSKKRVYRPGDIVGKNGVEKKYEDYLRGLAGSRIVEKDNLGRIQKIVEEVKPVIGNTIVLALDFELQKFVEEIMKDRRGTVGVLDLKDGGLLALVSKPDFDPNIFNKSIDPKEWQAIVNNKSRPLQNKFIRGRYSPGSVFKIVMAIAGLSEGVITRDTTVFCSGSVKIYDDRSFHCWRGYGHGEADLDEAMRDSCNVYFYLLGKKLDIDVISSYANKLGLGKLSGIDLPNEGNGIVPTRKWKQEYRKQKWFPGDTISVSIGGGLLNITPVQALSMISTVALRGRRPAIHVVRKIEGNGQILEQTRPYFEKVDIPVRHFETVIEGLWQVVNKDGTGKASKIDGHDVCGKTGTQQIISKSTPNYKNLAKMDKYKPHAWFASFAPRNNPRYAMVVFVENGGDAGGIAVPIAGQIYRKLFKIDK